MSRIFRLYRKPALDEYKKSELLKKTTFQSLHLIDISTEYCFNLEIEGELSATEWKNVEWLFSETFEKENLSRESFLEQEKQKESKLKTCLVEVGPRLSFSTAWSTNAISILKSCEIEKIKRVERSTRYLLKAKVPLTKQQIEIFTSQVHDRMTECEYKEPIKTFETNAKPQPVQIIPLLEQGKKALELVNKELGLAFDDQDIEMYFKMFKEMGRNPTSVELFDLSQSNSEHSRHWFFRGRLIIDGKEVSHNLMQIVKDTLDNNSNSVLAFCDNSSAIRGYQVQTILPKNCSGPSEFEERSLLYHPIFTAETHNFPTGVAPKPGAETGTGGRIRDVHATGRGGHVIAGTAAYCVGNLQIPNYSLPWEDTSLMYPDNLASPLQIEIEASNGASDYGNKFGEPIIQGFTRSFGLKLPNGERREWIKPIMFTGGVGQIDDKHLKKKQPEKGMLIVKIGGPAYRIGFGGGSASSLVQGENEAKLDFNAVQRGDAEMEQKLNRVIRACIELGDQNPIISIHDQGAGGTGNVVKELVEPEGGRVNIREIIVGDKTLSVMELWGAEYQENDALLIKQDDRQLFETLCKREGLPVAFIGTVTGDGNIVVYDKFDQSTPVNLELEKVLGKMPPKKFHSDRITPALKPLNIPSNVDIKSALDRVLRLVSVGSKLFLTNKVDRSVTGLIAQQQCVGPLHLPLADVAVVAQSHFGKTGIATAIGEQPIKGLIDNNAMARMTVGETLTNLVWAQVSQLEDIKCSGNWMWAAKLPGEGAALYDAAVAMRDIMKELKIGIDGGKDSLSMAARVPLKGGSSETVKSPGTLVISAYVTCPDITKTITPDLKYPGESKLYYIDLAHGKQRLGGSAFAQVFKQIGNEVPDVEDVDLLRRTFNTIQVLGKKEIIAAGHDRSDGGLITTVLEMAFAGNCGIELTVTPELLNGHSLLEFFFCEELGLVLEVHHDQESAFLEILRFSNIQHYHIGDTCLAKTIKICSKTENKKKIIFEEDMVSLRDAWNETSFQLELLQANPSCIQQERQVLKKSKGMHFHIPFKTNFSYLQDEISQRPRVAILRQEGSNGDREMVSTFFAAGFQAWDVTMSDLTEKKIDINQFRGIVFVGGFSFADVLDSAKGWAGVIKFHPELWSQFQTFYHRKDTFSLGICNGCQLMALLGWIPWEGLSDKQQPRFIHNLSGRFESRFSMVKIMPSPAMMLKGMEDSVLGVWVAHGEGRAYFPDSSVLESTLDKKLAPIRYVDDDHHITEEYPYNPNGSPQGIASLCSTDGRHLAIMPHPERASLLWQWPFLDNEMKKQKVSPWTKMFQNARQFCEN